MSDRQWQKIKWNDDAHTRWQRTKCKLMTLMLQVATVLYLIAAIGAVCLLASKCTD